MSKRRIIIIPRIPIKIPPIGSGKIKRRVQTYKVVFNRLGMTQDILRHKIKTKKDTLHFYNNLVRDIFYHWNSKGAPFISHKEKQSKIVLSSLTAVKKASQKYKFSEIAEAIDLCYELFHSKGFKLDYSKVGIKGLTLRDFIKYRPEVKLAIKKFNKDLHNLGMNSWMKECMKDRKYIMEKYSFYLKDENKQLTKALTEAWIQYDQDPLSPMDKNSLVTITSLAVEFAKLNEHLGISAQGVIHTIDNMINKFKMYKPRHLGWMVNKKYFWNRELPKELVRFGTVQQNDARKINRFSIK